MSTVTIIGGHGKVALLAAPLLIDSGHTVRSIIRKQEQVEAVEATGANAVVANVELLDVDSIAQLIAGSSAIVWSAGVGGGDPDRTWRFDRDTAIRVMQAAERADVQRFVMVSYFNSHLVDGEVPGVAKSDGMYAYYNAKSQADEYLRKETDLDWTVLGPSVLTLDAPTDQITVVSDDADLDNVSDLSVPATSRANVAAVVAAVVDEPASIKKTLNFHDGSTPIAEAVKQGM
ncbi:NAD(P)H-binding protein [Corynebacterium sp. H78]|uniref:NAD(P)H-binding protein n=1 Tax=Corynebacterium sp. H78 TaxID=3133417 RepID=UPI0030A23B11